MMFFTMLFMYSAFVLTSIATEFYVKDIAKLFEYYVYFWGAGDLIEELICCFVSLEKKTQHMMRLLLYENVAKDLIMRSFKNIKSANQISEAF